MERRYRKRGRIPDRLPDPLWKVLRLGTSIDVTLMAYKTTFWRLTSTSPHITLAKVLGGSYNKQETLYVSLKMKHDKLEELKKRYDDAQAIIDDCLGRMAKKSPADRYQNFVNVLTLRYSAGMKPSECAKTLSYSGDYERELHRKALEEFKRIMEEKGL